jgi:asparagine synthetase B (glutamine-hydrolysing)
LKHELELTPLEIAGGLVSGTHEAPWPEHVGESPRQAFEALVRDALARPPCVVTFSGGRDSSAVLAVAADVARREELDPPLPVTLVFPGKPGSDEDKWQRQVIDWIGLADWHRVELHDELDLIGPVARPILRRHGVLYPANCHFLGPAAEVASGGTFVTGWGGDDLFATWPVGLLLEPLRGQRRAVVGDLRRLGVWSLPRPLRTRVVTRFGQTGVTWLAPEARARVQREWAEEYVDEPRTWRARVRWLARRRYVALGLRGTQLIARDAGAESFEPFFDPRFMVALAHAFGRLGPRSRTAAMRALFSDLLPEPVLRRRSKGVYLEAFVTDTARAFVRVFDDAGLDGSLVDPATLRRAWSHDRGILASASLVQSLWLASDASARH